MNVGQVLIIGSGTLNDRKVGGNSHHGEPEAADR